MDIKKIDAVLTSASVEELTAMAQIARAARSGLVRVDGDDAGTWSIWAVVPERVPEWLWKMSRTSDSWQLSLINESLSLISSDVRVTASGKPFTNVFYYSSAGYRDNEQLIKWSNSSPQRMQRVKQAIDNGENLIGAARFGFEAERLELFAVVFDQISKEYGRGEVPEQVPPEIEVVNRENLPYVEDKYYDD